MKYQGIFGKMVLSVAILTLSVSVGFASEEEVFTHSGIGDNPHESRVLEDPHRQFRTSQTDRHSGSFDRGRRHGFSSEGLRDLLHLDDGQAKKMRLVFREYRKGVILKKAQLRVAQIEIDAAVGDEDLVISDIEKLVTTREVAASKLTMVRVQALVDAKSFLSKEQFHLFMARVARQMQQGSPHARQEERRHHGKKRRRHEERGYDDYE